jgi:hypothetical protein
LVFDGNEQILYCHSDDVINLGREEFQNRFYTRLRRAYGHFRIYGPNARKRDHKGQDMLKLDQVDRIRSGFRLPPRVCCNESVMRFSSKAIMFKLRYLTEPDRQRALDIFSKFNWEKRAGESKLQLGSTVPLIRLNFCLTHAIQAMTKIGLNLLANFCTATTVNLTTFPRAVAWIKEGKHNREFGDEQKFGFIKPSDVAELSCPPKSHKFRLAHDPTARKWKLYASFFEGKVATYVAFEGPNHEQWSTMDVIAPYDRSLLPPQYDLWYRPIGTHVVIDVREIVPSVPWREGETHYRRDFIKE